MNTNVAVVETSAITLEAAQSLLEFANRTSLAQGFAPAIAITDAGGHLRAFMRADGAPFLAAELAIDKAWTAASFGMSTHVWNQYMGEPTVAPIAHHPRLMPVGGGVPLVLGGKVIGGIGISGGTSIQDHDAAVEALTQAGLLG